MQRLIFCGALLLGLLPLAAQTSAPVIAATGFILPIPIPVAPGGLLTLYVEAAASSNVTAVYSNGSDQPVPVVRAASVSLRCTGPAATCAQILGVTVQIPYGIPTYCALCERPISQPVGAIAVIVDGVKSSYLAVQPFPDQVHFLTTCDAVIDGSGWPALNGGLPCPPMVTHSDGKPVSGARPAIAGEELIAYASGLGETNPSLTAGQPAPQSSPTVTTFGIDFNFRANALATQPGAVGAGTASPLFTGATKGFVGLYQVNFIVPAPPAGLQPCIETGGIAPGGLGVQSNLTVSIGSNTSFDGAGICVLPSGTAEPLSRR